MRRSLSRTSGFSTAAGRTNQGTAAAITETSLTQAIELMTQQREMTPAGVTDDQIINNYALTSGQGAKVGQLFGVATNDPLLAADVALDLTGVFELIKIGLQAWTVSALVYWNETSRRCTTVTTANLLIGVSAAAVAGGAGNATGRVRVNSSFRANDP